MTPTTGRDRLTVAREIDDPDASDYETFEDDGQHFEEIEVFNHVSVERRFYVNAVNGYEEFTPTITRGDMDRPVEAVTERVATLLWDEFGIQVEDHDIEAIDVDSEEVRVL